MRSRVEITFHGVSSSAALERYVGEQARALELECERIQACQVVVEALRRQAQQGASFGVWLNITLPGTEVVVNREHGGDVYIALRDAFEAARLQLKDHMRRQGDAGRSANGGASNRGTPGPGG